MSTGPVYYAAALAGPELQTHAAAYTQQIAARKQVAAATAGYPAPPDNLMEIEGWDAFKHPPVDNGEAYRAAAFYLAVAARYLGSKELALKAAEYAVWASPYLVGTPITDKVRPTVETVKALIQTHVSLYKASMGSTRAWQQANGLFYYLLGIWSPAALDTARSLDDSLYGMLERLQKRLEQYGKIAVFAGVGVGAVALGGVFWMLKRAWRKYKRR